MRWLRALVLAVSCASVGAACSSGEPAPAPTSDGPVGEVSQAITAACGFDTIGLPCDPDGPGGGKLECEGVCALDKTGLATCQAIVAGTLNGVICGTTNGIGNPACKRFCSGRTCLAANAPSGAACRPAAGTNPCEGQCDGSGKCEPIVAACAFGRVDQLCKFDTCNFANATTCLKNNIRSGTTCSDADACSIGKCSGGQCVAGPTAGCDDGNSCTDDACDPVDGGCTGTPNDANGCSDSNACTSGDHCTAGACIPGGGTPNCDDSNACTTDSCDPNTGCAHVQKNCSDGDACTDDSCDTSNAQCSHAAKTCDDADPCTTNGCNTGTGCVFTAINCDDNDACTADSCAAGACLHPTINCDDNNDCTADSCDVVAGCAHAAIAGCGVIGAGGAGGAGGEPATTAGTSSGGTDVGGTTGTAGTVGVAGAPDFAGAPGAAGSPVDMAGAPSEAGAPGTPGGGTDSGGTAGTAGIAGTAGVAGATSGSGQGGNATAGNTSGGGDVATAGTTTADGGVAGSTAGTSNGAHSVDDGGCGCRTAGGAPGRSTPAMLAMLALGAVLARRRKAA